MIQFNMNLGIGQQGGRPQGPPPPPPNGQGGPPPGPPPDGCQFGPEAQGHRGHHHGHHHGPPPPPPGGGGLQNLLQGLGNNF
ncbi:MAG: hypothetical protein J0I12_20990 [Candidatus Eremiobacteraeota bacterium]|nr:hypothetical protein [Candidatus Eremiobacteraeota bacterium]